MTDAPSERADDGPYRVLARKYRPTSFDDLIGQGALVRILTNALEGDRLAQAFILTGVRGVGKTTSARIIARALNCIGPDGNGGPTPRPCGVCAPCQAIAEDRHIDVIEMDAASRTGVGDIRELIEGVRYRPVEARRKVYIIDEVHMLSTAAFNALLKTLEEPPEHVVFIFATTEIRKIPITVLSRCQRFDLRRVDQASLEAHFAKICEKEAVDAEADALRLIARAADGSVRDGLSLLDQAIALAGGKAVTEAEVHGMLGLTDRTRIFDLFDHLMKGEAAPTLELLDDLYRAGADPAVVIQDLLELTHGLSRAKLVPDGLAGEPEAERTRGAAMAESLSLVELGRSWQLLLKGLAEVRGAPHARQAAEMVLIRLLHASRLPTPADLVRRLQAEARTPPQTAPKTPSETPRPGPQGAEEARSAGETGPPLSRGEPMTRTAGAAAPSAGPAVQLAAPEDEPEFDRAAEEAEAAPAPPQPALPTPTLSEPPDFAAVVRLAEETRAMMLAGHLKRDVHLVRFEPGRIEFRPGERAPAGLAQDLGRFLSERTGRRWMVTLSQTGGEPTLHERLEREQEQRRKQALDHSLVKAALGAFPGARVSVPRDKTDVAEPIAEEPDSELETSEDDE
jgi:DNA polymerase-3 subunit gamma/tau